MSNKIIYSMRDTEPRVSVSIKGELGFNKAARVQMGINKKVNWACLWSDDETGQICFSFKKNKFLGGLKLQRRPSEVRFMAIGAFNDICRLPKEHTVYPAFKYNKRIHTDPDWYIKL